MVWIAYLRILIRHSMKDFQAQSFLILLSVELALIRCSASHKQEDALNPLHRVTTTFNSSRRTVQGKDDSAHWVADAVQLLSLGIQMMW